MSEKKQRIPTSVKIIAAILTPLLITAASIFIYATEIQKADQIYPHVKIAGIDVSGMTRSEAIQSLGLPAYEERSANANVTFTFPNDSELFIEGDDVTLHHNAYELVSHAHSIGRGRGLLPDFISFLQRRDADVISYDIIYTLDENKLKAIVTEFTSNYNDELNSSEPVIYEDRIVYTKGVGHVNADIPEVYELANNGLFKSLESGNPVEINYSLPEVTGFGSEILDIRDSIFVQTQTSTYDRETNAATQCAVGIDFDPVEAAWLVRDTESGKTVTIPLVFTDPDYTQEHLDSLLFRDLIAKRTTYAQGTENRLTNIRLSTEAINGLVLLPGEEFSFNEVVGERSTERVYKSAPVLSNGEFVIGTGGGICQTSSTIYAAIKPSALLVTEQMRHGRPVAYLPWGWDATVAWGVIDFRFVNNTDYPIRIDVELDGRNVTAEVWGTIKDDFPRVADWNDA